MDIEGLAKESGLDGIMGSLKDGDDVWIACDVLAGLEKFANTVREATLEDVLLEMAEQDRSQLKSIVESVRLMRSNAQGNGLAATNQTKE